MSGRQWRLQPIRFEKCFSDPLRHGRGHPLSGVLSLPNELLREYCNGRDPEPVMAVEIVTGPSFKKKNYEHDKYSPGDAGGFEHTPQLPCLQTQSCLFCPAGGVFQSRSWRSLSNRLAWKRDLSGVFLLRSGAVESNNAQCGKP